MRFSEVDLLGVFISPMSVFLLVAWILLVLVRRLAEAAGVWRHFWHPALASLALYVVILSAIVIGAASWAGGSN
jgi:hypothetical protein